jgi:hypothetical protein
MSWATALLGVGRIRGQKYEKWLEQRLVLVFNDTDYVNQVRKKFGYDKTNITGRGQLTKQQVLKEVCARSPEDQKIIDPRLNCQQAQAQTKGGGYTKTKKHKRSKKHKKTRRH